MMPKVPFGLKIWKVYLSLFNFNNIYYNKGMANFSVFALNLAQRSVAVQCAAVPRHHPFAPEM